MHSFRYKHIYIHTYTHIHIYFKSVHGSLEAVEIFSTSSVLYPASVIKACKPQPQLSLWKAQWGYEQRREGRAPSQRSLAIWDLVK